MSRLDRAPRTPWPSPEQTIHQSYFRRPRRCDVRRDTSESFTFAATDDTVDDDDESVLLGFGALPTDVSTGGTATSTVTITDNDDPAVTVSFGSATYTVAEGGTQTVTVTLSADPERTVTIPIIRTNQDGASNGDYSGVPAGVTFNSRDTSESFTFAATDDTVDDDDESVLLGFGALPTDVSTGGTATSTVTITDNDDPAVTVSFGSATYTVAEGGTQTVTVTLSADPERTVTIPIVTTEQVGASSLDYSGVPSSVTFNLGETSKSFDFMAVQDTVDDDGESVKLAFGTLPPAVSAVAPTETTVVITDDDDPQVAVSFEQPSYSVPEGGSAVVTVTLSADPERTVLIPITKANQGTASDADYSGVPASVVFNSGETEKSFTFTATDDTVDDDGESVLLGFGALPTDVSTGGTPTSTVTITDNDDPAVTVSFGSATYTVAEGNDVTVTVTLSADPERTVTIPLTAAGQDGLSSSDYSGVPGTVTFSAGDTSKAFTFSATQDMYNDDGESVLLSFGTLPPAVRAGTPSDATVTITDDDDPPEVAFDESAYTVSEGGIVSVEVKLAAALESAVTVPIRHTPQGTTSSGDYSGVPVNVTFNTGETEKSFTFSATQDMVDDDGESVLLSFGTLPPAVRAGTPGETTVSITDDDIPSSVVVSFGSTTYTVTEGGTVDITVILDDDPEQTVTVPIRTINEGGASDSDYSGVPATVTFSSGETEKTFTVTATEDNLEDGGEGVKLSFGTLPPETTPGTTNQATVIIINKAAQNSLTVGFQSAAYSVPEGNSVTVTVILSAAPGSEVTVLLTVTEQDGASAADYSGVPVNVMFSAGETSKAFTVSATQDMVDDDGESVVIRFGTLSDGVTEGGVGYTTVDIRDDDSAAGKVALALTPATINESGTGNASTVTASIPSASSAATTVTVSVNPADTTTLTGNTTLTIPAGDTDSTGVVTITAVNDDAYTGNRTVAVSGTAVNSVGVTDPDDVTLTIRDDDAAAGKVALALTPATINESGTGNASTVTASIPSASSAATTVTVSVNPADTTTLTGNTTLTIPAGDTNSTGVVTITAVNDDAYTGNRTVAVSGTAVNSVGVTDPDDVTLTIRDDDSAAGKVALALTPATINESGTGNASTVTASIPSASSAATTVTVSVNPADTTTLTGNTTLTISAGDTNSTGVVTITAVNDDAYTGNRTVAVSGTAVNSVGVTDPDDVTLTIRETTRRRGRWPWS